MRLTVTVWIEGINLEKLLREAARSGITLRSVVRLEGNKISARVFLPQLKAFKRLCSRSGWQFCEVRQDVWVHAFRGMRARAVLPMALALGAAAVFLSSQMILAVHIEHAMEHTGEVRRFLAENGVRPGRMKAAFSTDDLRARLNLAVPGLAFAGLSYEGSTLVVDCRSAQEAQKLDLAGDGLHLLASQEGIVKRISVRSGTPRVNPGEAVRKGQMLIEGVERAQGGEMQAVRAQGEVTARVFAQGSARVSLTQRHTAETGNVRRRVTLLSPWGRRVVRDAQPFASQDVSSVTEPVVGLYLPLWRQIDTYAETVVTASPRDKAEAASWAQRAAQEIAKKQCPFDALILDKTVDYSMIDNEFLYATVVLEYEAAIAERIN